MSLGIENVSLECSVPSVPPNPEELVPFTLC